MACTSLARQCEQDCQLQSEHGQVKAVCSCFQGYHQDKHTGRCVPTVLDHHHLPKCLEREAKSGEVVSRCHGDGVHCDLDTGKCACHRSDFEYREVKVGAETFQLCAPRGK